MRKEIKAHNDWKQERDRTINYLKSRRTQDGGIIVDDFTIQALRDLYKGPSALNGNKTMFTGTVPGADLTPTLIACSIMLVLCSMILLWLIT